jgi:hypothetical protein
VIYLHLSTGSYSLVRSTLITSFQKSWSLRSTFSLMRIRIVQNRCSSHPRVEQWGPRSTLWHRSQHPKTDELSHMGIAPCSRFPGSCGCFAHTSSTTSHRHGGHMHHCPSMPSTRESCLDWVACSRCGSHSHRSLRVHHRTPRMGRRRGLHS